MKSFRSIEYSDGVVSTVGFTKSQKIQDALQLIFTRFGMEEQMVGRRAPDWVLAVAPAVV